MRQKRVRLAVTILSVFAAHRTLIRFSDFCRCRGEMTVEPVPDSETSKGAALRPLVQCERPAYVVLVRLLFPVDTEVLLKTISLYL